MVASTTLTRPTQYAYTSPPTPLVNPFVLFSFSPVQIHLYFTHDPAHYADSDTSCGPARGRGEVQAANRTRAQLTPRILPSFATPSQTYSWMSSGTPRLPARPPLIATGINLGHRRARGQRSDCAWQCARGLCEPHEGVLAPVRRTRDQAQSRCAAQSRASWRASPQLSPSQV